MNPYCREISWDDCHRRFAKKIPIIEIRNWKVFFCWRFQERPENNPKGSQTSGVVSPVISFCQALDQGLLRLELQCCRPNVEIPQAQCTSRIFMVVLQILVDKCWWVETYAHFGPTLVPSPKTTKAPEKMTSQKGDVSLASISFQGAFAVRCREAIVFFVKKKYYILSLGSMMWPKLFLWVPIFFSYMRV